MTFNIDPEYAAYALTAAQIIIPPVFRMVRWVMNKSITVIVITHEK